MPAATPELTSQAVPGSTDGYAPSGTRPLGSYLALIGAYGALAAGMVANVRRRRSALPKPSVADLALLGMATHKLSRRLAKDPVTSPLRAPFTHFEGTSGPAELQEDVRGEGMRRAVGELVTCPFCLSQWIATGFVYGFAMAPAATRLVASVFGTLTVADSLQCVYAWLERKADGR